MKIWLTRHGQTDLNKKHLMQGLTDEALNEDGIAQAEEARSKIGDMHFDAVYSSSLERAKKTAAIIGGINESEVIVDDRIIEIDFGKYEMKYYYGMGIPMMLYMGFGDIFPAPKTVETTESMVKRSSEFLKEIEQLSYENVLIACHGGIIRALSGYLEDKENGLLWRPRPKNCEIRIYECENGKHKRLQ